MSTPFVFFVIYFAYCLVYRNLVSALLFTNHAIYINFSRVDPQLLAVDSGSRIKMKGSETFCQGLMSGVVTSSKIISSVQLTGLKGEYKQHRVTIAPFPQEMRRYSSVWGQLLNFTVVLATTSRIGISFVTRGDNQVSKYSASCEYFSPVYFNCI